MQSDKYCYNQFVGREFWKNYRLACRKRAPRHSALFLSVPRPTNSSIQRSNRHRCARYYALPQHSPNQRFLRLHHIPATRNRSWPSSECLEDFLAPKTMRHSGISYIKVLMFTSLFRPFTGMPKHTSTLQERGKTQVQHYLAAGSMTRLYLTRVSSISLQEKRRKSTLHSDSH